MPFSNELSFPPLPTLDMKNFKSIQQQLAEDNYASNFAEHILRQLNDFNSNLPDDYETGICIANFGQTVEFPVTAIGFINPSLIFFVGRNDNNGTIYEIIQHVSQINFGIIALKKQDDKPKRPIGFFDGSSHECEND